LQVLSIHPQAFTVIYLRTTMWTLEHRGLPDCFKIKFAASARHTSHLISIS